MDTLFSTLVDTTNSNMHKRIEKQQNLQIANQMKINNAMNDLFEQIKNNVSDEELFACAHEGYNRYEIFSFQKGETFHDLPLIFLTKGPQNFNGFGYKYFEDIQIIPYVKLLQQHFAPFKVYFNNNYKNGKTSIYVSWGK